MAFTATNGMAGLAAGVPLGADLTAEQLGAVAERAVRLNRAMAAGAGAAQGGWFVQGCVHGLSFLIAFENSLTPQAPVDTIDQ